MRAAGVTELGGPVRALALPDPPGPTTDGVLIEVFAAGVANWDEIVRAGGWDVAASPPMALGVAAAGVVRSVGSGVARWRPTRSSRTRCRLRQGTWAELFPAREDQVARKPAGMSFEEAAVFPVPALTATQVLSWTVELQPGAIVRHEAAQEMGDGPPELLCREKLQTTACCVGQEPGW